MTAPEGLQVGAVCQRHLDLDEYVARAGLRTRDLFEPQIPDAVEAQRSHGVEDHLQRGAGAIELEALVEALERQDGRRGYLELGEDSTASRMCRGVAEREPVSVSSRR